MTRVLARMRLSPVFRRPILLVVAATIAAPSIELVKAAVLSFLSSTGFKPAFFTDRFLKSLQLNQFLIAPARLWRPDRGFRTGPESFRNRSIQILSNLILHLRRSHAVSKQV
jgi:hypothetical protein